MFQKSPHKKELLHYVVITMGVWGAPLPAAFVYTVVYTNAMLANLITAKSLFDGKSL